MFASLQTDSVINLAVRSRNNGAQDIDEDTVFEFHQCLVELDRAHPDPVEAENRAEDRSETSVGTWDGAPQFATSPVPVASIEPIGLHESPAGLDADRAVGQWSDADHSLGYERHGTDGGVKLPSYEDVSPIEAAGRNRRTAELPKLQTEPGPISEADQSTPSDGLAPNPDPETTALSRHGHSKSSRKPFDSPTGYALEQASLGVTATKPKGHETKPHPQEPASFVSPSDANWIAVAKTIDMSRAAPEDGKKPTSLKLADCRIETTQSSDEATQAGEMPVGLKGPQPVSEPENPNLHKRADARFVEVMESNPSTSEISGNISKYHFNASIAGVVDPQGNFLELRTIGTADDDPTLLDASALAVDQHGTDDADVSYQALVSGTSAPDRLPEPARLHVNVGEHVPRVLGQIVESARTLQDRPVELTLNPEELGRVRMTLHASEGTMTVQLTVERPETLDLLRRHIEQLAGDLRQLGYDRLSFGFSNGQGQGGQHTFKSPEHRDFRSDTSPSHHLAEHQPPRLRVDVDGMDLRI